MILEAFYCVGNETTIHKRNISRQRAAELKQSIDDYSSAKTFHPALVLVPHQRKTNKIKEYFSASDEQWKDCSGKSNRITTIRYKQFINLSEKEIAEIDAAAHLPLDSFPIT